VSCESGTEYPRSTERVSFLAWRSAIASQRSLLHALRRVYRVLHVNRRKLNWIWANIKYADKLNTKLHRYMISFKDEMYFVAYLTTFSLAQNIANCREYGRKLSWSQPRYYPSTCRKGLRKTTEISIRITGLGAGIWTRFLPSMKQAFWPLWRDLRWRWYRRTDRHGYFSASPLFRPHFMQISIERIHLCRSVSH
jgi:hypothetical protein